jgi:hypothetical protein
MLKEEFLLLPGEGQDEGIGIRKTLSLRERGLIGRMADQSGFQP